MDLANVLNSKYNSPHIRYFILAILLLCNSFFLHCQSIEPPTQEYVLRFSGEQVAYAPDNPLLNLGTEFTMMGWFYFDEVKPGTILMGRLNNPWLDDPNIAYTLGVTNFDTNNEFQFLLSDGTANSQTFLFGGTIPLLQWTHVAVTFNGQMMKIFINGEEVGATPFTGIPNTHPTRFGVGGSITEEDDLAYGSGFSGFMKQLSVWNRTLSGNDITEYAKNGLEGNEAGLVAAWDMGEPNGNSVADKSTNGLNLAFSNGTPNSQDRTRDPLFYLEEGVDNPWFQIHEQPWFETLGNPAYVAQDIYPIDFDHDGLNDILVTYVEWPATETPKFTPLHALKNNGDGTFSNVTETVLGDVQLVLGRFGEVADFNGDGLDDVMIVDTGTDCCGSPGTQNTLLVGTEEGLLTNASATNLPAFSDANHGFSVGDIDNDGDLDILTIQQGRPIYPPESTENKPEVFINDGTGQFTLDYTRLPESRDFESGTSMALIDWDRNGLKDLAVGVEYSPRSDNTGYHDRKAIVLLQNTGNGKYEFTNGAMIDSELSAVESENGFEEYLHIITEDVNGDGWQDLIVSLVMDGYLGGRLDLYLNDGEGNLILKEGAFQSPHFGPRDVNFWFIYLKSGDFNNDGWIDILAEGGHAGDLLFLNKGDGTFQEAGFLLSPETFSFGSASAVADFTGDGRTDIVSVSYGKIQLLENLREYPTSSTNLSVPQAPSLTLPANAAKASVSSTMEWKENSPFALSDIQVAKDDAFSDIIFERENYTGFQWELTGLTKGTTYYWKVRGENTAGTGEWSATSTFHVNQPPTIENQGFMLEENSPVGTSVGSVVATDGDMDELIFSLVSGNTDEAFAIDAATGELTVQTETAIDFETTPVFTLEVDISDGFEHTQASITISLTDMEEDPVTGIDKPYDNGIHPYPNPTKGIIQLGQDRNTLMKVTSFQVLSLTGQTVMEKKLKSDFSLDISPLDAGIYIIRLIGKSGIIDEMRVIKQ